MSLTSFWRSWLDILDLNDDCFEVIYSMLKFRDQVSFMHVCQRFRNILKLSCDRNHKIVNLEDIFGMSQCYIYEFLKIAGPSIKTLLYREEFSFQFLEYAVLGDILLLIGDFCFNLEILKLKCILFKEDRLSKLIQNVNNITELHLYSCHLYDDDVLEFVKLPKLEKLSLWANDHITGKHLNKLINLRELKLLNCDMVKSAFLVEVCKSLTELQALAIIDCKGLTSDVFLLHCHKLKSLGFTFNICLSYDCIVRLPALKRFTLWNKCREIFYEFAQHKSTQLEYLEITGFGLISLENAVNISHLSKLKQLLCLSKNFFLNDDCLQEFCKLQHLEEISLRQCSIITNVGLLNLVRQCQRLKIVYVQYCRNITDQFVLDVIELLRQQQKEQHSKEKRNRIIFYVYGTGISELIMKNAKCQNFTSLLKLSFNLINEGSIDGYYSKVSDDDDSEDGRHYSFDEYSF